MGRQALMLPDLVAEVKCLQSLIISSTPGIDSNMRRVMEKYVMI